MKTDYVIVNYVPDGGEILYWNSNIGWTANFNDAHTFDREILKYPLPVGGNGIMEVDDTGKPHNFFQLTSVN